MNIKLFFYRLWDLNWVLFGAGSWSLRTHERKVVDAALAFLDDDVRLLLHQQLKQPYFVERTNKLINIVRFYDYDDAMKIPDPLYMDHLLRVRINVEDKKQTAHVTFYKGFIFSIEFKKPGKFYIGKEMKIVNVRLGKPDQTYTGVIDRLEHGRGGEDNEV